MRSELCAFTMISLNPIPTLLRGIKWAPAMECHFLTQSLYKCFRCLWRSCTRDTCLFFLFLRFSIAKFSYIAFRCEFSLRYFPRAPDVFEVAQFPRQQTRKTFPRSKAL